MRQGSLTGSTIHGFLFNDLIGKGGFSEVYRVHSIRFDQDFCAKVISVDEQHIDSKWSSFQAEVSSLMSLDHPHIIRLYEHFRENNQFFLILEFCELGSLLHYMRREPNISESQLNSWILQILEAVAFCHSQGIAHRDIKPGNFLLDQFKRVKLADFGISLLVTNDKPSQFTCSRTFAPPEVLKKHEYDPMKADIWSLGVTLYCLIAGRTPWPADDTTNAILMGNVIYGPDFPLVIKPLMRRMITENPDDRIPAEAARKAFQELIESGQLPGDSPSSSPIAANHSTHRIRSVGSTLFTSSVLQAGKQLSKMWMSTAKISAKSLRRKSKTLNSLSEY